MKGRCPRPLDEGDALGDVLHGAAHVGERLHQYADQHAEEVIGWAFSAKPDAELVIKALDMAYEQRRE